MIAHVVVNPTSIQSRPRLPQDLLTEGNHFYGVIGTLSDILY